MRKQLLGGRHLSSYWDGDKFRQFLEAEFTARCRRNPRYSLRAFARFLDIQPATLSQLMSGKRSFTGRSLVRLAERLGLGEDEVLSFARQQRKEIMFHSLEADFFALISDWYHYAIWESACIEGFDLSAESAADIFGVSVKQAGDAIDRLERLNLLNGVDGRFQKTTKFVTNHSRVKTSAAHRSLQKQIIAKALGAVDEISPAEKDITSITFAIDEACLPEVRELIKDFRRKLDLMFGGKSATRVYNLAIQMFPVSKSVRNSTGKAKPVPVKMEKAV